MDEKRFSIKTVADQTGLSTHVLRVWEQRYSLIKPARTDSNQRQYSQDDIDYLKLIARALQSGYRIGDIADLDPEAVERLITPREPVPETDPRGEEDPESLPLDVFLDAIRELDGSNLEKLLRHASVMYSPLQFIHRIVLPLLNRIGDEWMTGTMRIMHEHLATSVIRPFLIEFRNAFRTVANAPACVIATPVGQEHEMGALISGVFASAAGWRTIYLGTDLPAEEIAAAAHNTRAALILLSIIYPSGDPMLVKDLEKLASLCPDSVSIVVGGRAAGSYHAALERIHAQVVPSLQDLQRELSSR